LTARGYVLTQNPDDAHFMLQANILKVGKSDARASEDALSGGFGGVLLGSVLSGSGNSPTAGKNIAVASGILGFVVDAMVAHYQIRGSPVIYSRASIFYNIYKRHCHRNSLIYKTIC
jgi:hypothetical protein